MYVNDIQKKKKSRNKRRLGKENSSCLWFIIADKLEQCLASSRLIKHYEIGDNRDGPILRAFIHENLVRNCHRHCSRNNRDLSRLLAVISCRFRKKRRSIHRRSWKLTIEKYRPLFVALPSLSLFFLCKSQSPRFDEQRGLKLLSTFARAFCGRFKFNPRDFS